MTIKDIKILEDSTDKTIYYTGCEIQNEDIPFKDIAIINGNQFLALECSSHLFLLFLENENIIKAIDSYSSDFIKPFKVSNNCKRFALTQKVIVTKEDITYEIEAFDVSNPGKNIYLKQESNSNIRIFQKGNNDDFEEELHGILFSHKTSGHSFHSIEQHLNGIRWILMKNNVDFKKGICEMGVKRAMKKFGKTLLPDSDNDSGADSGNDLSPRPSFSYHVST